MVCDSVSKMYSWRTLLADTLREEVHFLILFYFFVNLSLLSSHMKSLLSSLLYAFLYDIQALAEMCGLFYIISLYFDII